jgi:tellurite resistance protein TehA-like permease
MTTTNDVKTKADADGAAIGSIFGAFLFPPLGIILGHVSRSQAKRHNQIPSSVATLGCVLGYIFTIISLIVIIIIVAAIAKSADPTQQYINCINQQLNDPSITCSTP